MDLIMMTHPLIDGHEHVLSSDCRKWITDHSVKRIVLMNVKNKTNPVLNSELKELAPGSELEILELPRIGLQDQKTPSELNGLPWQILTQICRQIRPDRDTTIFLGRGAAIYDHVLWLTGQCYPGVKALHIDSCQPVLSTRNIRNHARIEETILPALLTSFLDDIKNKRIDVENYGYTDKERFMGLMNATVLKGVAPALKEMVDEGGVEKYTYGTDVTYRLTPKALQDAVSTYYSQKPEKEADLPNLTIAFGRLPRIQSRSKRDQVEEFQFFSYLTPLQPMDGLLVVLQRLDDSIPESSIMTLEDALIRFEGSDFIGDLRHAYAVIDRRTKEYDIDVAQHLVVINPKPDPQFQMDMFLRLLAYCEEFENIHGTRQWDIDLTMPLNRIRSAVSFFSYATHTPPTYVLKSKEDSVIIPRRSLVLSLPNRIAKDAFEQQMNPHGNNKGDPNCLMGLYLWELENTNDDDDIFAILDDQHSNNASIGIEPKNLKKKLEEYGLQKGNSHVHRVLGRLVQARLVSQKGSGFYLTDLGRFVAEQIHNIRQVEVIE